jgi:hypothetical protein
VAQEDILIGGSGAIRRLPVGEFLKQQAQFQRIAVLADPATVSSFTDTQVRGVELVVGSFLDVGSYAGAFVTEASYLRTKLTWFK